jgi:hypothetical protein
MRKIILLAILTAGGMHLTTPAAAADPPHEWLKRSRGWLSGDNAAWLHLLPVRKSSVAELYYAQGDGRFVNYHESNDHRAWGARTGSFARLSRGVVGRGEIEYTRFNGQDMGGATFLDPDSAPFTIVETADTNRGTKSVERYALAGAVSARVAPRLHVGLLVDYKTANMSKHKDLRHKNTLLDMTLAAGLTGRVTGWLEVGGNYYYRRVIEGVSYAVYGNTDRQYLSLVDFGAFFGRVELFGDSGYTASGCPLFTVFNGASLQCHLARPRWELFNVFTFKTRRGYFGEKSSTGVCYSGNTGDGIEYRGIFSWNEDRSRFVELRVDRESLENHENIYRTETSVDGVSRVVYYGQSRVLSRAVTRVSAGYGGREGLIAGHPAWEWHAGARYFNRDQTVSLYPFYRKQAIRAVDARLFASRYLAVGRDAVGLSLGVAGGVGDGAPKEDGVYAAPSADQAPPKSADHLLYREHEFLTIARGSLDAALAYVRALPGGVFGYARVEGSFRRALEETRYLGGNASRSLTFKAGCLF